MVVAMSTIFRTDEVHACGVDTRTNTESFEKDPNQKSFWRHKFKTYIKYLVSKGNPFGVTGNESLTIVTFARQAFFQDNSSAGTTTGSLSHQPKANIFQFLLVFFEMPQATRPRSSITLVVHASLNSLESYVLMSSSCILLVMNINTKFQCLVVEHEALVENNQTISNEKQNLEAFGSISLKPDFF